MALFHHSTPRWRDAPLPRATAGSGEGPDGAASGTGKGEAGGLRGRLRSSRGDAPGRARRMRRGRRLLTRALPVALIFGGVGALATWASSPNTMSPDEVARAAHEQVVLDVVRRTGDYSMTVGKLDCVEIEKGRGNCLADTQSATHKADGLMIAVGYVVDPADGQLELVVKLP